MSGDTIREFLISIGYTIDKGSERKFVESVKETSAQVGKFAAALAAMAAASVAAIAKVADSFDNLYFASKRTNTSIENIRALQYAFTQLGGTAGGASGAIEGLAKALRVNPGNTALLNSLGVSTKTAAGGAREANDVLIDLGRRYAQMPSYIAAQYGAILGQDEETVRFLRENYDQLAKRQEQARENARRVGLDQKQAGKNAREFNDQLGELRLTFVNLASAIASDAQPTLTRWMRSFNEWIADHAVEVRAWFTWLVQKLGEAGPAFREFWEKSIPWLKDTIREFQQLKIDVANALDEFWKIKAYFDKTGEDLQKEGGFLAALERVEKAIGRIGRALVLIRDGNYAEGMTELGRGLKDLDKNTSIVHSDVAGVKDSGGVLGAVKRGWKGRPTWLGGDGGAGGVLHGARNRLTGRAMGVSEDAGAIGALSPDAAKNYADILGQRESGNRYGISNSYGYRGRWQMGGDALFDTGYVSRKGNGSLANPSAWTGKNGINSLEDFLANKNGVQDKQFVEYTNMHIRQLRKAGVIRDGMSDEQVAGHLAAAHLKGVGGAIALARGQDGADANGTRASSYFSMMKGVGARRAAAPLAANTNTPMGALLGGGTFSSALGSAARIMPPEAAASGPQNLTIAPVNHTTIHGVSDPAEAASLVKRQHDSANTRLQRNVQSAVA